MASKQFRLPCVDVMKRNRALMTKTFTSLPETAIANAMDLALAAARLHEGATSPNPPVGCTLLDDKGAVLATAAHHGTGQPHAEALAIAQARAAGVDDRIHTVVVTLEPCNHHGRTPPCTEAILATSARAVVVGIKDPNSAVKGGGLDRLAAAGLSVRLFGHGKDEALARLIAPFAKRTTQGLSWVTVKQALSASGSMIPPAGQKTFTSESSLVLAHRLRRRADAIFTGSGTVLADDPLFTVRHVEDFSDKRRKLVLFDRRNRIPAQYRAAALASGFDVISATSLEQALRDVASGGGSEVLVEAGPRFTAYVLQSPFWDEHVLIRQGAGSDHIDILDREKA
jgi:diaminohydroxyphosphoribosylaminopyrimidine deaminase / 5-amino-6-(5-phosphoribosylamino)uracil reductase